MQYENVLFAVDSHTNGLAGRKYKNIREAIEDGSYMPWNSERIKRGFKFGEGTINDLKNHCKINNETLISAEKFLSIIKNLPDRNRQIAFINEVLGFKY